MRAVHFWLLTAALVVLFSLLSSVLTWYLVRRGSKFYRELHEVRLDPLGLRARPAETPGVQEGEVVVFYGDSRAESWPDPAVGGFHFVNLGIGGQTSSQVARRYEHHVDPVEPRIVIVQVGINDLKTISLFPERKEAIISGVKDNIRRISLRATGSGAAVVLTTVFPLGRVPLFRKPFWSDDVSMAVKEVNDFIRSLEGEGVVVFDACRILEGEEAGVRPEYEEDLLHINPQGYRALNDALIPILKGLRKKG